eukprot:5890543-Heterocapsa_arctica.AAC.1
MINKHENYNMRVRCLLSKGTGSLENGDSKSDCNLSTAGQLQHRLRVPFCGKQHATSIEIVADIAKRLTNCNDSWNTIPRDPRIRL